MSEGRYNYTRDSEDVGVTGFAELYAVLEKLPVEVQEKMERKVLRKALEPIHNSAVGRVPVGETGNLAKGLSVSVRKINRDGGVVLAGRVNVKAKHAHLVEFGHRIVGHKPGLIDTGETTEPQPFLRPAVDENVEKSLDIVIDEFNASLKKYESNK